MITFLFRRHSGGFSIERLFAALYEHLSSNGTEIERLEVPHVSSGICNLARNASYVRRGTKRSSLVHITGDVHYAALFQPFRKTVITVHDCVNLHRGGRLKRFVFWLLWYRLPLAFADAVTVVSEQTKRELLVSVPLRENKIHVIGNFIGSEFAFSPSRFNAQKPRILHIGTGANKNLARVIPALRDIPCVLVIVGKIDEAIRALLEQHRVEYENHVGVGNDAMVSLYASADLISFPSTYEGFGMPILEGQAVGRPVLTSDMEPMRSVAGKNGALLVDPLSEDSIREGFRSLISNGVLRERLVTGGVENLKQYRLDAVAKQYLALYESL